MANLQSTVTVGSGAASNDDGAGGMTEQELFTVLSNGRRFAVLRQLADQGGPLEFGALVETVAADEFGVPAADLDQKQERRVYVALHQNHLPYLEEHGLVEWDRNRGVVSLGDVAGLERYLYDGSHRRQRSFRAALGLSLLSVGVAALSLVDVGLVSDYAVLDPLLVVTVLLFAAAGATWLRER